MPPSRDELHDLAEGQAALRRVATLVAAGGSPEQIFTAVSDEVRTLVGIDITTMFRCEVDDTLTLLAVRSEEGSALDTAVGWRMPMGRRFEALLESGRPRRLDAGAVARWTGDIPGGQGLGLRASVGVPIVVGGEPWGAIFASSTASDGLPPDAEGRLADFAELVAMAIANAQAQSELRLLADEQAALRRVATLAIGGTAADDLLAAVAREVGRLVGATTASVYRCLDGGEVRVAGWSKGGPAPALGELRDPRGNAPDTGPQIGVPIRVEGRPWGTIVASLAAEESFAAGAEDRIRRFTELVAIAVSDAAAREALAASNERLLESRARLVAAADEERARVVRDLHDGAQQRLVQVLMTLKLARSATAAGDADAAYLMDEALEHAERAHAELRELAHGIMPSVLTHGGLQAAVRSLVAPLPVPVRVDVSPDRLPHEIEANAYFIIAEALTNVLKHAQAGRAEVRAKTADGVLTIAVRDDGVGGADLMGRSSGLLGLHDRAVAVDGTLHVESPAGGGTTIEATLPLKWNGAGDRG